MYMDYVCIFFLFFFKQKTAYEMRISDWSSDVCSSDLGCEIGRRYRGDAFFPDSRPAPGPTPGWHRQKPMQDPYKLLNVDRAASQDDIKRAYRKLAKEIGRASCRERVCQYV